MGVKAEPRLLREPTTFENLSSALQEVTTLVATAGASAVSAVQSRYAQPVRQHSGVGSDYASQSGTVADTPTSTSPAAQRSVHRATGVGARVLFASFDWTAWEESEPRTPCLLLGYADGFQVWDIRDPHDIQEIVSVKCKNWDGLVGSVTALAVVPGSVTPDQSPGCYDSASDTNPKPTTKGPLVAVAVSGIETTANRPSDAEATDQSPKFVDTSASVIMLYSLRENRVVAKRNLGSTCAVATTPGGRKGSRRPGSGVSCVRCNARWMVVETSKPPALHVFSLPDLAPVAHLTDLALVAPHVSALGSSLTGSPTAQPPLVLPPGSNWTIGTRLLAYASVAELPAGSGEFGAGPTGFMSSGAAASGIKIVKDVGEAGLGLVKTLGDIGYQKLSNYFSSSPPGSSSPLSLLAPHSVAQPLSAPLSRSLPGVNDQSSILSTLSSSYSSSSSLPTNVGAAVGGDHQGDATCNAMGTLVIRDLAVLSSSNRLGSSKTSMERRRTSSSSNQIRSEMQQHANAMPYYVHFKAHDNPVYAVSFNPAGTLLATASSGGHTVNVFEIVGRVQPISTCPWSRPEDPPIRHVYKLQRGLTTSVVQDLSWSSDSRLVSAATARGTVHVWALDHIITGTSGISSLRDPYHGPKSRKPASRIRQRCQNVDVIRNMPHTSEGPGGGAAIDELLAETADLASANRDGAEKSTSAEPRHTPAYRRPMEVPAAQVGTTTRCLFLPNFAAGAVSGLATHADGRLPQRVHAGLSSGGAAGLLSLVTSATRGPSSETRTEYEDMYSWSPTGVLTMHRLRCEWALGGSAEAGGTRTSEATISVEDIAEWDLVRGADWEEVHASVPDARRERNAGSGLLDDSWLPNAEIVTHPPVCGPRLWTSMAFQVFASASWDINPSGWLPPTVPLAIRRHIPKPFSPESHLDDYHDARPGDDGEATLVDESACLAESLSTAMETQLDFVPVRQSGMRNESPRQSLSFEEAYHIESGASRTPSSLPAFRRRLSTGMSPLHSRSFGDLQFLSSSPASSSGGPGFFDSRASVSDSVAAASTSDGAPDTIVFDYEGTSSSPPSREGESACMVSGSGAAMRPTSVVLLDEWPSANQRGG